MTLYTGISTRLTEVDIKQVVLTKLRLSSSIKIPRHTLDMTEVTTIADYVYDQFIMDMRTFVTAGHWTEKFDSEVESVPETWWDHFKDRFFSKTLLSLFPAKYKNIASKGVVNNYWIFPEIPPNPDKNISHFVMAYTRGCMDDPYKHKREGFS